jgi:hypothetical protein
MKSKGLYTVSLMTALIAIPNMVLAFGSYLSGAWNFNALYPKATSLQVCALCHVNPGGGGTRNTYGLDFEAIRTHQSATPQAFRAIETADSDGDTYTNLTEISGNTFPWSGTSTPAKTLFVDNFANVTATGAPNWQKVSGTWSGRAQALFSAPRANNLITANPPTGNGALTFGAGVIQTDFTLVTTVIPNPNAFVIFSFVNATQYRFVKVSETGVSIGQVGTMGPDTAGTKASGPATIAAGAKHKRKVAVSAAGKVDVFLDAAVTPALSFTFAANQTGRIGYRAAKSKTKFDNFVASK